MATTYEVHMESTVLPRSEPLFTPRALPEPPPVEPILRHGMMADRPEIWALHLGSPIDDSGLFGPSSQLQQVLAQLDNEIRQLDAKPQLVAFPCASLPWESDFPIDNRTLEIVSLLADHDIISGLTCRSELSGEVRDQLIELRDYVRVNVPVISADVSIQKALEPNAALLPERLQMAAELRKRGVLVQLCLEPILPNLTDTRESIEQVLSKVAKSGAESISAGYLYLRRGQKDLVQQALEPHGWSELVQSAYSDALVTRESGQAPTTYLSKARRQRGYALLMSIAAEFDLDVRLSRSANPDFQPTKPPDAPASARFQAFIHKLRRRGVGRNVK